MTAPIAREGYVSAGNTTYGAPPLPPARERIGRQAAAVIAEGQAFGTWRREVTELGRIVVTELARPIRLHLSATETVRFLADQAREVAHGEALYEQAVRDRHAAAQDPA